ncbi:MAG: alkaline phosphatase family protein [Burkholderiales bacterium]
MSATAKLPRFVVFVFDALRRDMITAEHMPRLRAFIDEGCDFPSSRCAFPSATRVNAAALACGAMPGVTGVIANQFFDARVYVDKLFHTGRHDDMQAAEQTYGGAFVTAPTLGDVLASHGHSVAVVSSGSAGTTHLLNPRSAVHGHVTLCLSDWRRSSPALYADGILRRHGPIPAAAKPNLAQIRLQMDIILESVLPEVAPDVLLVWFSDPDSTYHQCGIGSPESLAAIANADQQFGRFLDLWRTHPERERCTVAVCSDHAQLSAERRVRPKEAMRAAGLAVGNFLDAATPYAGSAGYYGAIRVAGGNLEKLALLAQWLQEQPWCGHVFTPGGDGVRGSVPGTLDRSLLMLEHARTPELYYTMRADDAPNRFGLPGTCWFASSEIPDGGGTHGGLHRIEMNNLLALQGDGLRQRYRSPWPASQTDLAPTLLDMLGIEAPAQMTGRVLAEARESGAEPPPVETRVCDAQSAHHAQFLRLWRVGTTTYIDQGWVAG